MDCQQFGLGAKGPRPLGLGLLVPEQRVRRPKGPCVYAGPPRPLLETAVAPILANREPRDLRVPKALAWIGYTRLSEPLWVDLALSLWLNRPSGQPNV